MFYIRQKHLVTVDVFYYLPDYPMLVNEFLWQTNDHFPELPRVHKFLDYWRLNIDAILKSVEVAQGDIPKMRHIKLL